MGDKGFIEKNFQLMKDTMEADKERANRDADEQEGGDGTDEVPGARKKRGARSRSGFPVSRQAEALRLVCLLCDCVGERRQDQG